MLVPEEIQKESSEIPGEVVVKAKEKSKALVDKIPDPSPPNTGATIDVGASPTGPVTAAPMEAVGTVPSTENVVMDENLNPIEIDAVSAVVSNVSAEVVAVDQCPQDGKIHVDLTLPDLDDVVRKIRMKISLCSPQKMYKI